MNWNDRRNSTSNQLLEGEEPFIQQYTSRKTRRWWKTCFLHRQRRRGGTNEMCRDHQSMEHGTPYPAGQPTLNSDGKKRGELVLWPKSHGETDIYLPPGHSSHKELLLEESKLFVSLQERERETIDFFYHRKPPTPLTTPPTNQQNKRPDPTRPVLSSSRQLVDIIIFVGCC